MKDYKLNLLYDTFKEYFNNYLVKRDLESTLEFINKESFTGIGTGKDELVSNYEEGEKIYTRAINEAYNEFSINNQSFQFEKITDDVYIVYGQQDIKSNIDDLIIYQQGIRYSLVFKFSNGKFKLCHTHSSLPCYNQNIGESYPIEELKKANKKLGNLVVKRTFELEKALKEIEKIASIDYLTGVLNRRKFEEFLEKQLVISKNFRTSFCIVIFDIDNFKIINDNYGHIKGDNILKFVASTINDNKRKCDIFARWGGEEFILLLPNIDTITGSNIIKNILNSVKNAKNELNLNITLSAGLSEYILDEKLENLIIRADNALYKAKFNGKDRLEVN